MHASSGAVLAPCDVGYALDIQGALLGQVLSDGRVMDAEGLIVGVMQPDGSILSDQGLKVGSAYAGVCVRNSDGGLIGALNANGLMLDLAGEEVGGASVDARGIVRDLDGEYVGIVVVPGAGRNAVVRCESAPLLQICMCSVHTSCTPGGSSVCSIRNRFR